MSKVVKYGTCEPENRETVLDAHRNGVVCLNAAEPANPLRKDT
jgi:hypothetical protein